MATFVVFCFFNNLFLTYWPRILKNRQIAQRFYSKIVILLISLRQKAKKKTSFSSLLTFKEGQRRRREKKPRPDLSPEGLSVK